MKCHDIKPFDTSPEPKGVGLKINCAVARLIRVSNSHTIWLDLSKCLGGDSIADGWTDGGEFETKLHKCIRNSEITFYGSSRASLQN